MQRKFQIVETGYNRILQCTLSVAWLLILLLQIFSIFVQKKPKEN